MGEEQPVEQLKRITIVGIIDPERVVLVGNLVPEGEKKPTTVGDDEVEVILKYAWINENPPNGITYRLADDVQWWFNDFLSYPIVKVVSSDGRYVYLGEYYLRKAVEYLRWITNENITWKKMLRSGEIQVYMAKENAHEAPLVLVCDEYAVAISPLLWVE